MNRTSVNIQQLKEMHTKLQSLNTNINTAIGNSREFHSNLENKLQESIIKLQQNIDQSVKTDSTLQNEKLLLNIHKHFQEKCSQIEEQNQKLIMRLNQMENQEQNYKDQIENLSQQLQEKSLISKNGQILCNNQGYHFSFKPNQSENNQERDQNIISTHQQLEESVCVKNEIDKLHKEIQVLLSEKKNIIAQQEQNQLYLQQQQNQLLEQLHQSDIFQNELSTGSNHPVKANQVVVASFHQNDLKTVTQNSSPFKNRQIQNQQSQFEEIVQRNSRFQNQSKSPIKINYDDKQIQNQRQLPQNRVQQSIHSLSPTKVNFSKCFTAQQEQKSKNQEMKVSNFEMSEFVKQEQEKQMIINYQEMLQKANQELQIQQNLQQQQKEEFIKERNIRIQMQMKLEELEAKKRTEDIQISNETYDYKSKKSVNSSSKYENNIEVMCDSIQEQSNETPKRKLNDNLEILIDSEGKLNERERNFNDSQTKFYNSQVNQVNKLAIGESFSSPNKETLCNTPQKNRDENISNSKSFSKNENMSIFTPQENLSPQQQFSSKIQSTDQQISKFKPIHTTLKLNNVNSQNNESKLSYQISVSPNRTIDSQNISNNSFQVLNNSNQNNQQQIQLQLVDLISKLQTTLNNKKRSSTPLKDAQRLIETAQTFDYAIDDKLSQLKQILTLDKVNSSCKNISSSDDKKYPSQYLYDSNQIYTSEFNTSQ